MKYLFSSVILGIVLTVLSQSFLSGLASDIPEKSQPLSDKPYFWTTDHMHVGVRWQPFGLPGCELYDANRPILSEHSSYAQFWVSWHAVEPRQENTDYENHMSGTN